MTPPRLLLLTRPDCHLCEEFAEAFAARFPDIALEVAGVDDRADWRDRYGSEIPVLLGPDGEVLCRTRFDPQAVQRWLDATAVKPRS